MSEKLSKLRDKCTEKQVKFVEAVKNGADKAEAYEKAGFKPKNRRYAQQAASKLLTTNIKVMDYLSALKDEEERKTNISRGMQLSRLNSLYRMALSQENVSAAKEVIKEQNEMLGYHREKGLNPEKEAQKAAKMSKEDARIAEKLADELNEEDSQETIKPDFKRNTG